MNKKNTVKQNENEKTQELIDEEVVNDDSGTNNQNDKIESLNNQLRRAVADYQNLERRTEENKRSWIMGANKDLILKLLPVLDNLFLAQKHITDNGLNLSVQKFLDVLRDEGVERIETIGRNFDPNLMECVTVVDGEENKVLEEVRVGFIMNNEPLRPAQVTVGGKQASSN